MLERIVKAATLEVFRARVRPERLGPIVSSFEDGSVVHTGEDVPAADYRDLLSKLDGMPAVLADLGVGESPAGIASGIEFVLEGLHLTKRLNKDAVGHPGVVPVPRLKQVDLEAEAASALSTDKVDKGMESPAYWPIGMHLDLYKTIAGLIVGFVIGLTGMGGGALMTPVLVLMFGVNPGAAVSADVVTSLVLKPFGGSVHVRRRTVNWRLVRWLMIGSIPSAFAGAYLLDDVIGTRNQHTVKTILGWVLIVAAGAILAKLVLQAAQGCARHRDDGSRARTPDSDLGDRRAGWAHRRDDLGRFGVADHRGLDDHLSAALVEGDGRHRPRAGDPARRARLRSATCSSGISTSRSSGACCSVRSRPWCSARTSRRGARIATSGPSSSRCWPSRRSGCSASATAGC